MTDEDEREQLLHGYFEGVVVDRADPNGLGCVRVRIPGLVEPASNWAFPVGNPGGGIAQRGFFFVPEVGAEVGVFFVQGNVDQPRYLCGHWGVPDTGVEVPTPVAALAASERPEMQAIETAGFLIIIDNREGREQLVIKDKVTSDHVTIDRMTGVHVVTSKKLALSAVGDVEVTATGKVSVNGSHTDLQGGGAGVARLGDDIVATIPPGVVFVPSPVDGSPIPSPLPIDLPGKITRASEKTSSG